ncbi:MAG: hypothetical protein ABSF53_00960 [Terracidiphilus sp.]|jgi:hypothetical protein
MSYLNTQHIPLTSAYLCQDCDSIGNHSSVCPACASMALLSVAAILDRSLAKEEMHVMPHPRPRAIPVLTTMVA